ncbi:MAG TPA: (5-formylfuran-3-yl)methyl phosphate synthase [Methylotenera sp.]|jgi:uncharacterized protein (UPF0264 family)
MPQLLISVTSVKEAQIALQCGADIIDLKDPDQGALGALPLALVTEVVTFVNAKGESERKVTSATIGDLAMEPELLLKHALALSKTKVDIIKIGFFRDSSNKFNDYEPCLEALKSVAESGVRLIAVLFAEYEYPASLVTAIKSAGFYGVMFDTAVKNGATFLDYFSIDEMKEIADNVQAQGLLFGLAGSLNLQHVAMLKAIAPDYMGFRGGVCVNNQRRSKLEPEKIRAIHKVI